MPTELFTSQVEDSVYPGIFSIKINAKTVLDNIYSSKKAFFTRARYAFATITLHDQSITKTRDFARAEVTRLIKARWFYAEVGLYLVIIGPEALWLDQIEQVKPDITGFHATIIQAIHFIDPETGTTTINQSKWGAIVFGKKNVSVIIEKAVTNLTNPKNGEQAEVANPL